MNEGQVNTTTGEGNKMKTDSAYLASKQQEILVLNRCNPGAYPAVEVAGYRVVGNETVGFVVAKPPPTTGITEELTPLGAIFRTFVVAQKWVEQIALTEKKIHACGQELYALIAQSYQGCGIEAAEAARLAQFQMRQQPEWDVAIEEAVSNAKSDWTSWSLTR